MQRHFLVLAIIIGIGLAWYFGRRYMLTSPVPLDVPGAHSAGSGARTVAPVRQITPLARQHLVEEITAARAVRASHAAAAAADAKLRGEAPPAVAGPAAAAGSAAEDHTHDLDHVSSSVLDALQASVPFLAACYEQGSAAAGATAVAQMTLTNDPDIGAVIDPDQILDGNHAPLDPKTDACLRSTIQTLQLPPLDAGDTVKLEYSFKFDGAKPAPPPQ